MGSFERLLEECEGHLRAGHDQAVARLLAGLTPAELSRKLRLPFANVCRRASLLELGLRLLAPVVRDQGRKSASPATPDELAEYAILLQRYGAVQEALQVLNRIDPAHTPAALLYRSFCHFNVWEHEKALPLLSSYIEQPLAPYQRLVGLVNLAAAYVNSDKSKEAEPLLRSTIEQARAGNHKRLEGNCHELLSQMYILTGRLQEARESLEIASEILTSPGSLDRLIVATRRSFLLARLEKSVRPLEEFRQLAQSWPHPESVREADFNALIVEPNEKMLERLYFGTPYASYRERIVRHIGRKPEAPFLTVGEGPAWLDLETTEGSKEFGLRSGSATHRILTSLALDQYRPPTLGTLFGRLFPGEIFDIFSSPARIHQAIMRARRFLEESEIAARIHEDNGKYRLSTAPGFSLRISAALVKTGASDPALARLEAAFPLSSEFTSREVREKLDLSSSSAHRLLQRAIEEGHLDYHGASTARVYYFKTR